MIYYFTPFSLEKDLGKAYNDYMRLLPKEDDWACFVDGDTCFLTPDFGQQLNEIVQKYPNTGLFTCLTNRVGNLEQCYQSKIDEDPNILTHRKNAIFLSKNKRHEIKPLRTIISGHLMMVKKSTWEKVGGFPEEKGMLGVDNRFSKRILTHGFDIQLMMGVLLFHFYRLDTGRTNKSHLL